MKVEYFPTKNWYISKRNMVLFGVNLNTVKGKTIQSQRARNIITLHYSMYQNVSKNVISIVTRTHFKCIQLTLLKTNPFKP